MKTMIRVTGWGVVLAALALLFALLPFTEARASADSLTEIRLKTEQGVRTVTMEEYLPRAVAAEMPASFGTEALKAQAVAIRTYAAGANRHDNADVCDDGGCCLGYLTEDELLALWGADFSKNMERIKNAVAATDGEILTYNGEAIQAVFHASSYGCTEDSASLWSAQPYLVSVSTPETPETVSSLLSETSFTPDELSDRLGIVSESPPESWLGEPVYDKAGRISSMTVAGQDFSGTALRSALGLRSTAFEVIYQDGLFLFSAAGYGHGVGMSQTGAGLLAAEGWKYDEILLHYYPGTVIRPLPAAFPP